MARGAGWVRVFVAATAACLAALPARADAPRPDPIANSSFEWQAGAVTPFWYVASGTSTQIADVDGDGDYEARIPAADPVPVHDLFQVLAPPLQTATLNFDRLTFALESGTLAPSATIRLGFALSPTYEVHPFVGAFDEGSLVLPAGATGVGPDGRVSLDPLEATVDCTVDEQGRMWMACADYRSEFNATAGDPAARRALLGRARIVEIDLTAFSALPAGEQVVIDNVEIAGDRTVAETTAQSHGVPLHQP